jgi:hypothetical protein
MDPINLSVKTIKTGVTLRQSDVPRMFLVNSWSTLCYMFKKNKNKIKMNRIKKETLQNKC